ncbi:hypothetical protein PCL1606_57740 [Pseudomonas chlororaphis]|uniref:Uncharacterized protein n=1 Tax=Pseudomonas chlororaphis TaxID=587753 RepID=A0A0D5Y879_9PSED|nr:hypothetical protein PCL1606_57740 [Pseudomonas chlororaphis]
MGACWSWREAEGERFALDREQARSYRNDAHHEMVLYQRDPV